MSLIAKQIFHRSPSYTTRMGVGSATWPWTIVAIEGLIKTFQFAMWV